MFFLVIPDTYFNKEGEAVLMFTPTLFTVFDTTKSSDSVNFLLVTSCWYCPTPILSGVILTSSDRGSWSLLPMDIALLFSTVRSGNSSMASLLAEYTLAPASETIMYSTGSFSSLITRAMNCSDSLDAVPFPMAIISMLYLFTKFVIIFFDSSYLLCGSCG